MLLHGDGQYAPELLPQMVEPLIEGRADAVLGSRMLVKGAARRGGMPLYKFVGNKILTTLQNALAGTHLSEFHSGYRAYRTAALRSIDVEANSDDFDFDTQIILQLHRAGRRIVEIPIPTYYGDEICYVNGIRYGRDVLKRTLDYRLARAGLNAGIGGAEPDYAYKPSETSSHGRIVEWMAARDAAKVLDVGCASGQLGRALRRQGHYVVGVDAHRAEGVEDDVDEFVHHDLDRGLPPELDGQFDVILCADVLEHLRQPDELLAGLRGVLGPTGTVLVEHPQLRPLVPAGARGFGALRLRPAGHPRRRPPALLHRPHVPPAGRPVRVRRQPPGSRGHAVRRPRRPLVPGPRRTRARSRRPAVGERLPDDVRLPVPLRADAPAELRDARSGDPAFV